MCSVLRALPCESIPHDECVPPSSSWWRGVVEAGCGKWMNRRPGRSPCMKFLRPQFFLQHAHFCLFWFREPRTRWTRNEWRCRPAAIFQWIALTSFDLSSSVPNRTSMETHFSPRVCVSYQWVAQPDNVHRKHLDTRGDWRGLQIQWRLRIYQRFNRSPAASFLLAIYLGTEFAEDSNSRKGLTSL